MYPLYDKEKFQNWVLSQPNMKRVSDIHDAQWLTIDGVLYGTTDDVEPHEVQEKIITYLSQWSSYLELKITKTNFWSVVHEATGLVRVVPDTEIVRTMIGQELTPIQTRLIEQADFELEPYTKNRHYFTYNL